MLATVNLIMEITVGEKGTIEVRKVYNEVTLITNDNEKLIIAMRDSGFEFMYQGKMYSAKEGMLKEGL